MIKKLETVRGADGIPVLEMVREDGELAVYEADDLDRQIRFPAALIPEFIKLLEKVK